MGIQYVVVKIPFWIFLSVTGNKASFAICVWVWGLIFNPTKVIKIKPVLWFNEAIYDFLLKRRHQPRGHNWLELKTCGAFPSLCILIFKHFFFLINHPLTHLSDYWAYKTTKSRHNTPFMDNYPAGDAPVAIWWSSRGTRSLWADTLP